jgi:hypothetical protein
MFRVYSRFFQVFEKPYDDCKLKVFLRIRDSFFLIFLKVFIESCGHKTIFFCIFFLFCELIVHLILSLRYQNPFMESKKVRQGSYFRKSWHIIFFTNNLFVEQKVAWHDFREYGPSSIERVSKFFCWAHPCSV